MIFQISKRNYWWIIKEIVTEIFKISLISYLIFYLIETLQTGFITNYFNLNILLIISILSGIFVIIFKEEQELTDVPEINKKNYIFIIITGIVTSLFIYYKIHGLGWISWFISIISGFIIILLSILLLNESDDDQRSED